MKKSVCTGDYGWGGWGWGPDLSVGPGPGCAPPPPPAGSGRSFSGGAGVGRSQEARSVGPEGTPPPVGLQTKALQGWEEGGEESQLNSGLKA